VNALPAPLLGVCNLTVRFGGVTALDNISFAVHEGQICALIGPNGAGKTTAFNAISRFVRPSADSEITFNGTELLHCPSSALVGLGISRTFQNLALWPGLTVLENVMVGAHAQSSGGFVTAPLGLNRRAERDLRARAYASLAALELADFAHVPCTGLSYGTLKRIELARAIVSRPKLLMLDEPAAGLTHEDVRGLGDLLRWLRDEQKITVLLVEHHMQLVMDVSDYVVALDFGELLVEGPPEQVRSDPRLVTAYLGKAAAAV
jgi:branched-chain amino acid transport system ATP-binding protein